MWRIHAPGTSQVVRGVLEPGNSDGDSDVEKCLWWWSQIAFTLSLSVELEGVSQISILVVAQNDADNA